MSKKDVIVIGAGPGGSITAHRLAEEGKSVLLLEKASFPRLKTCGDLLTREGLEALEPQWRSRRSGKPTVASAFGRIRRVDR